MKTARLGYTSADRHPDGTLTFWAIDLDGFGLPLLITVQPKRAGGRYGAMAHAFGGTLRPSLIVPFLFLSETGAIDAAKHAVEHC